MAESPNEVVLTSGMTYGAAQALIAAAWPRLRAVLFRPTVEHYKEGRPTAEELELGADDELCRIPDRKAILRGGMTGQNLQHAVMTAFGLETEVTGDGIRGIWRTALDEV
ncbi:hypothetical protein J8F10_30030 [Gemmata sp. G18]|uniref:Uncharacterized protein n=1 Tax=Gemmata palustris TaxID=2822762 RepID=A0ABS5C0J2_9BACT|nr:hypothetical protein [Gemmata palustris]MBP3959504.1 hypothetical protein [Gemmata palustris]